MINKVRAWFKKDKAKEIDDRLVEVLDSMVVSRDFKTDVGIAVLLADVQRQRAFERQQAASDERWKRVRRMTLVVLALAGVITSSALYLYRNGFKVYNNNPVSVVSITGEIGTQRTGKAEFVIPSMRRAFENRESKGVILRINSPGGLPNESERINSELEKLRAKFPEKKVVAVIETVGASAAYMIAVHADQIYAGRYSMVGSVGAMVSPWNVSGLAEKLEVKKESYASGKFKALLDPFKTTTPEEREKVLSLVNELGGTFAQEVVDRRTTRLKISKEALSTGEVWTGTEALRHGLIDQFGTLETVAESFDAMPRDYGPFTENGYGLDTAVAKMGQAMAEGVVRAFMWGSIPR
jgi:protease IV